MDGRIWFVKNKIISNLQLHHSIDEIAESINVSKDHLHKLFKKELGISPIKFVNNLRLEKAKELLENTFLRIKEIRTLVGINDEADFIRDFKKHYGLTPSEYRKNFWNSLTQASQEKRKLTEMTSDELF